MSKSGFGQMYRRLSSKLLDLVVTPHVLGEVPTEPVSEATETEAKLTAKKWFVTSYKTTLEAML